MLIVAFMFVATALHFSQSARAQTDQSTNSIDNLTKKFARSASGRYMEQNCVDTEYPGWTGFPLKKCTYQLTEKNISKNKTAKHATVIMLNAEPEKLARWVVSACEKVDQQSSCRDRLYTQIQRQSNAQLVVAGIVLEDMEADGTWKGYAFRDGVTVRLKAFPNGIKTQPTQMQVEASLNSTQIVSVGRYARITGTTRQEYLAKKGGVSELLTQTQPNLAWLTAVREAYQRAWRRDSNELLDAWVMANIKPSSRSKDIEPTLRRQHQTTRNTL